MITVPERAALLRAALAGYVAKRGAISDGAAELLADLDGMLDSGAIRQAARVLSGSAGGRPKIQDAALLDQVSVEICGGARSLWHACGIVARRQAKAAGGRAATIQHRLFGKARAAKIVLRKPDT